MESRSIALPKDLLEVVNQAAQAEGRRPEELVADAIRQYVSEDRWQRLLAYGKRQTERLGYTENDVERLIMETRQHGSASR